MKTSHGPLTGALSRAPKARGRFAAEVVAAAGVLAVLAGAGCSRVPISESVRRQADPQIPFSELRQDPVSYVGKVVVLGGEIIRLWNSTDGTFLLILEKPLDVRGRPSPDDTSGGRFVALDSAFLDPVIYSPGRRIVVAGQVVGKRRGKIGGLDYTYPVIEVMEKHLCTGESAHHGFLDPYPEPPSDLQIGTGGQPFDRMP